MADDPLGAVGWGLLVSFFQLFQQMNPGTFEGWIWPIIMFLRSLSSSSEVRTK